MTRLVRPAWILGALLLGVAAFVAHTFWRAGSAASDSAAAIRGEQNLPFTIRSLDGAAAPAVEPFSSAGALRDAAVFQEKLWAITPDTLWEPAADGELRPRFRSGRDLPSAPLTTVTVASLAGREPELWIGTLGEGVVAFDGRSLRQVLPRDPAARKITAILGLATGQLLLGLGVHLAKSDI